MARAGLAPTPASESAKSAARPGVAAALPLLGIAAPGAGTLRRDVEHVIETVGHVKVRFDLVDRLLVLRLQGGLAEGRIRGEEQTDGMRVRDAVRAGGTDVDVDRLEPHRLDVVQIAAGDVVPPRGVGGPDLHEPGVGAAAPVGAEVTEHERVERLDPDLLVQRIEVEVQEEGQRHAVGDVRRRVTVERSRVGVRAARLELDQPPVEPARSPVRQQVVEVEDLLPAALLQQPDRRRLDVVTVERSEAALPGVVDDDQPLRRLVPMHVDLDPVRPLVDGALDAVEREVRVILGVAPVSHGIRRPDAGKVVARCACGAGEAETRQQRDESDECLPVLLNGGPRHGHGDPLSWGGFERHDAGTLKRGRVSVFGYASEAIRWTDGRMAASSDGRPRLANGHIRKSLRAGVGMKNRHGLQSGARTMAGRREWAEHSAA